ncbi:MAG: hypothetical protein E3J64_04540 [Anaerolineales bacterium]|nr:MAG: hypothetical protein E3J64_04540 [Anaerolineales bacterium]
MEVDGSLQVLAVEVKDVAGSVNLGTLGLSERFGDYGGSIDRIVRSARLLYNSSAEQLRLMSQTVYDAFQNGNLSNALFTSSRATSISSGAQELFNGVYQVAQDGQVLVEKALPDADEAAAGAGTAYTFKHYLQVLWGIIMRAPLIFGFPPGVLPDNLDPANFEPRTT